MIGRAQRRMEAESYLTDGYGIRLAVEAKKSGWTSFEKLAKSWMPSRIKMVSLCEPYSPTYCFMTDPPNHLIARARR
jgi:hypothetical protein